LQPVTNVRKSRGREYDKIKPKPLQHPRRGGVEPLRIVHGDEHRSRIRESSQRVQERKGDRALIGRLRVRLLNEKSDLERTPTRSGKPRQRILERLPEQIGEGGEGKRRLSLRHPAGENTTDALPRPLDAHAPENRLVDSRLTRDHEPRALGSAPLEEALQGEELPARSFRLDGLVKGDRERQPAKPFADLHAA
jgi:hypothetical protein